MKYLIVLIPTFLLSACAMDLDMAGIGHAEYLENEYGLVRNCQGSFMGKVYEAQQFWKENNLPKGTTHYVCKDNKAYKVNKVTDCQNNVIINKYGSIETFKSQNNITVGSNDNIRFMCENGKPVNSPFTAK